MRQEEKWRPWGKLLAVILGCLAGLQAVAARALERDSTTTTATTALHSRRLLETSRGIKQEVNILRGSNREPTRNTRNGGSNSEPPPDDYGTTVVGGQPVSNSRIVGGLDVGGPEQYPWIVSLFYRNRFFCGGSLVSPTFVLTAAHCVDMFGADTPDVHLARYDIGQDYTSDAPKSRIVSANTIHLHPDFNSRTFDFDVALIELSEAVEDIDPVELASGIDESGFATDAEDGREVTAIGWGAMSEGGNMADVLQEVTVPIWSNQRCQEAYCRGSSNCADITPQMICAGLEEGGRDACQGDSGGPLLLSGTHVQLGIVSWGVGCARAGTPGVYASVPVLQDWIHSYL